MKSNSSSNSRVGSVSVGVGWRWGEAGFGLQQRGTQHHSAWVLALLGLCYGRCCTQLVPSGPGGSTRHLWVQTGGASEQPSPSPPASVGKSPGSGIMSSTGDTLGSRCCRGHGAAGTAVAGSQGRVITAAPHQRCRAERAGTQTRPREHTHVISQPPSHHRGTICTQIPTHGAGCATRVGSVLRVGVPAACVCMGVGICARWPLCQARGWCLACCSSWWER